MGFDWDRLQLVVHGGRMRLPRENGPYTEDEKGTMRADLQSDLV